ncbi:hypothetical protein [Streptomyces sp. NPDC002215]|uniref:hypothetical protein n=1 Tax=Streptomyces sp. NPDC002215 TaxID=3154412 RepID=UPI0033271318
MTLVLRTTDSPAEPATAQPADRAGTDPLPRLQYETQPPSGPGVTRCLNHPRELNLRGIPVRCSACRARRDVWVVCRCSNQWLEPEICRADFDALIGIPDGTVYPSVEQGLAALGFDGAFTGTYLE